MASQIVIDEMEVSMRWHDEGPTIDAKICSRNALEVFWKWFLLKINPLLLYKNGGS